MKILTVTVPAYNVDKYLEKGLDSLAKCRNKEFLEVLVVNDGSDDRTKEIGNKFELKYPGTIRLINKENGGHGSAINTGILHATGKFFRVMDGDDWVLTDELVRQIDFLITTDVDVMVTAMTYNNMTTGEQKIQHISKEKELIEMPIENVLNTSSDSILGLSSCTFKTEILKKHKINLLENTFYVDMQYVLEALYFCKTILMADYNIYQYLIGNSDQSVSAKNFVKNYSHHDRVIKELIDFYCNNTATDKKIFLAKNICELVRRHYSISLINNEKRAEGHKNAKQFSEYLKIHSPELYKKTYRFYQFELLLHAMHFNYKTKEKIKKVLKRKI